MIVLIKNALIAIPWANFATLGQGRQPRKLAVIVEQTGGYNSSMKGKKIIPACQTRCITFHNGLIITIGNVGHLNGVQ